ncbi:hypothetical protein EJB05_50298, partial [Eragrostis curvula]
MANPWGIAGISITFAGFFLAPIISFLVNKFLAYLFADADTSKRLQDLEIHTIPNLKLVLRDVEEQQMQRAAEDKGNNSDLMILDKMKKNLTSALYDAEDIMDLVDYHRIEKEVIGEGESHSSSWVQHLLEGVAATCVACCRGSWFRQWICMTRAGLPQSLDRRMQSVRATLQGYSPGSSAEAASIEEVVPSAEDLSIAIPDAEKLRVKFFSGLVRNIVQCCRSIFIWSTCAIATASTYRDWSLEEVFCIKINQKNETVLDSFLRTVDRKNLRKSIEQIEYILTNSKKSHLLNQQSNSSEIPVKETNKESSSKRYSQRGIDDLHTSIKPKVFGREKDREDIRKMLRVQGHVPSSSSSKHYSVIGIHGIAGSGKSTLARYVCDYEKDEVNNHFDLVMFIHVSTSFRLGDIFRDMLEQITGDRPSDAKSLKSLQKELKQKLVGRRFLLVLDDVWVNNKNRKELEVLHDVLDSGKSGSGVLVTSQREDAARALGAQELIAIPDLEEEQYFSMFMRHALRDTGSIDDREHIEIGRKIVKKLHRSPIAAVTVAAQLGMNPDIDFWRKTANLDILNETMGALWWSYQQLGGDIRRCFEYFSIFPKGRPLIRDELIRMWIAQGFIKTSNATEDLDDLGLHYFDELLSFSFVQVSGTTDYGTYIRVHDLLHELAERVAGREKVFENIITRLTKLRLLIINYYNVEDRDYRILSVPVPVPVPASIGQMKHLRYLSVVTRPENKKLVFPSTFSKLYHMQILDITRLRLSSAEDTANLRYLRHILGNQDQEVPNIGRLTSLQTIRNFRVREERGYELKQLKHLNMLCELWIGGLKYVRSKEEALEACLASKGRLKSLKLYFGGPDYIVPAEVLEGLCPPKDLERLLIWLYDGSRYPSWMLSRQNPDAPNRLYKLELCYCIPLVSIPEDSEFFIRLRVLHINRCSWEALPDNMDCLTSLQELVIEKCQEIKLLPTLPCSLKRIEIRGECELRTSCQETGHENWQKIQDIPTKIFRDW